MLRKLVTIRYVAEIIPIEGADFIELVRVDGWKCVVKKGQFKVGERVVYFEIDSFLPIDSRFEFLRKNCLKHMLVEGKGMVEGFRLRTIQLRGKISQGLVLPLSDFPEICDAEYGVDLSYKLGVLKYEAPVPAELSGDVQCGIPTIIKRTDQERIQNLTDYFTQYNDVAFEETEKEDGTSTSYYLSQDDSGEFCVAGHNWQFKKSESNAMWKHTERYGIEKALRYMSNYGYNVVLHGETVGEGIQKNPMCLKGHHFHIFDIYNIKEGRYFLPQERYEFLEEANNAISFAGKLIHVPVVNRSIKIFQVCSCVEQLLDRASGDTFYCKGRKREGLVYKSTELINGQVLSFKVVDDRNLAKEKD